MARPLILILDHNPRNLDLMDQFLKKANYDTVCANKLEEFQGYVTNINLLSTISLAILDISGFDGTVWESVEELRSKEIPFLIISTGKNPFIQTKGMQHGASRVLVKPLVSRELLQIVRTMVGGNKDISE